MYHNLECIEFMNIHNSQSELKFMKKSYTQNLQSELKFIIKPYTDILNNLKFKLMNKTYTDNVFMFSKG